MNFPKYPKYKDSGVEWLGEVPAHWNHGKVRYFAKLESGHTPSRNKPEYWENCTVPWFTLSDVWKIRSGLTKVVYETKEKVSELGLANSSARLLPAGTVILSRTASVGYSAILGKPMATTQDFANWICGSKLFPEYLLSVFRAMKSEFSRMMMGSTHKTIYMPDIAELYCAIPPMHEQSKIVTFLDYEAARIDALVEEKQRLIKLLKEKRQAVISHAVTKGIDPDVQMKDSGVEWLGEVPAHWDILRLKNISPEITVGIVVEPSKYYVDDGVPALRSLNVRPGRISTEQMVYISPEANEVLSKSKVRTGDLVAVRSGQPGTTAVVPSELDGCNCIDLIIIRKPSVACEKFLCWFFASDCAVRQFSEGSGGAIQQHFNISTAANIVVPAPSRHEQVRIAEYIDNETSRIDELIVTAESTSLLLSERRSALISAAVTGKIDVRGWQPPAGSSAIAEVAQTEAV